MVSFQRMAVEAGLHTILGMVRSGAATTRPDLQRRAGLGRTLVNQRITQLQNAGLVEESGLGPSTGGRAPRHLRFRAEAGLVLAAEIEARSMTVGLTDLTGSPLAHTTVDWPVSAGPVETLRQLKATAAELRQTIPGHAGPVWATGVGLPAPVQFRTGTPVEPPIMPGWDGVAVPELLQDLFGAPAWVDNEVNLFALGEMRACAHQSAEDIVYVKLGTGIGAGLISQGRLHRGSQGCAGDIGHVQAVDDPSVLCLCGKRGCLEAIAGGGALVRQATADAKSGHSPFLAGVLAEKGQIELQDLVQAAEAGDLTAIDSIVTAGQRIGAGVAAVVNLFNPSLVVVGGPLAAAGDRLLAAIKQEVFHRSLPLATRELTIVRSCLGRVGGMQGAAFMAIDQLFRPGYLEQWLPTASPRSLLGQPVASAS